MRRVLQLAVFRRLLLSTLLNQLASEIATVALSLLVYRRTNSALGASAFFLCVQFGPALLSPAAVARLDQRSARITLSVLYAIEVLIFLALAWLTHHFSTAPILAFTLVMGTLALVARVITRAIWGSVTSAAGLFREAQATTNTTLSVAYMIGPAIGGAVVAAGGATAALVVNAGVFLVMSLNVLTAKALPAPRTARTSTRGRLRAAAGYVQEQPLIRRLLSLQAGALLFFTISIPVEVVFARHSLHTGAGGYGAILSAWGAGAIAGSAAYARWRTRPTRGMIVLGATLLSAGFAVMAAAPSLAVALVGSAVAGVGEGIQAVAARTALQEVLSDRWMALVLSFNESLFQGIPGAGIALGGLIAAAAGPRVALAVAAVGSVSVAVAMRIRLPRYMGTEAPEPPPEREFRDPDATVVSTPQL